MLSWSDKDPISDQILIWILLNKDGYWVLMDQNWTKIDWWSWNPEKCVLVVSWATFWLRFSVLKTSSWCDEVPYRRTLEVFSMLTLLIVARATCKKCASLSTCYCYFQLELIYNKCVDRDGGVEGGKSLKHPCPTWVILYCL